MTIFEPDTVVDIVLRGVTVDWHGDHTITISVPGCDAQLDIPFVDDKGGPLRQVIVTRADIISAGTISVTPSPVMRAAVLAALADEDVDAAIEQAEFGQDYEPDPAKRIAAIAAEFPQFVAPVRPDGEL